MKAKITRRTIVGYAVNTSPTQDSSGYHFETPTAPMWEGTYNTTLQAMRADRYLNSLTNTYYSSAWFVKIKGTWFRVVDREEFGWAMDQLYMRRQERWDNSYLYDDVEVEVDYTSEIARAAGALGKTPKGDTSRENGKKGGRPRKS